MSAFGPKRTSLVAPHMSAFRGKADMTLSRESAFDRCGGISERRCRLNYEGSLEINNVVIPNPVQIKSRQIGITVPKTTLAGSHLGSAYPFHILFLYKYGSLKLSFILLVR